MLRSIFAQVKRRHRISGAQLARESGVGERHISQYLNDKVDVSSKVLSSLIEAMDRISPGAKRDFANLLGGKARLYDIYSYMRSATAEELGDIMIVIAESLQNSRLERGKISANGQEDTPEELTSKTSIQ